VNPGFSKEKMNMIWHDDVAEEEELVALTELFEGLFEDDTGVVVVEIWEAVITAEVDSVVVASLLIALQTTRHEGYGTSGFICIPPHPCAKNAHEWGTRLLWVGHPPDPP
jgi:hypothetical protein